ncbi:MAG TPA: SUF system NifU family Fe-S cluster assembly protein [Actinomycetes bacterium]|nr:SUF system NifU family Fe-S cluster assembly protein [Actinomycetes bacterium]
MGLEDLYQEIILDHHKKPRHRGRLEGDHVEVRHYNPVCGDELTLGLRLDDGRVADVAVDGSGCAISQASASVMTEQVIGRPVAEALETGEGFRRMLHGEVEPDEELLGDGIAFAGVARYPVRVKCALLGWMAFKDAVARAASGEGDGETRYQEDGAQARAAKAQRLPGEA